MITSSPRRLPKTPVTVARSCAIELATTPKLKSGEDALLDACEEALVKPGKEKVKVKTADDEDDEGEGEE